MSDISSRVWRMSLSDNDPLLTVVTVSFRPRALWEHLDSLARESFRDIEQILVMDWTTEGSKHAWVAEAMAQTADLPRSEYVVGMCDHDHVVPGALGRLADRLAAEDYPDVLVVGFNWMNPSGTPEFLPTPSVAASQRYTRGMVSGQCLVMKRHVWAETIIEHRMTPDDNYSYDLKWLEQAMNNPAYSREWALDLVLFDMVRVGMGRPETVTNGV